MRQDCHNYVRGAEPREGAIKGEERWQRDGEPTERPGGESWVE